MKSIINILAILLLPLLTFAQNKITKDYVEKYKGIAIREMKRTGIPASITLAQGILESASGESILARNANNHFGIKCKTEWTGPKIYKDDDTKNECFRVYPTADSSFRDHSNFLKYRPYYAALFELDPVDDTAWAYGLKKAGYATERDYPQRLLKIIDDYELAQYNFPELVAEDSLLAVKAQQPISTALTKNLDSVKVVLQPVIVKDSIKINTTAQAQKPKISLKENEGIKKEPETKTPPAYPINQRFKINQTPAIWGVKGRSFLEIANTYNLALYKLYKFNELPETDLIENDQIIFLGEKRKESNNKIHIVKNEETLYEISQSEGIQLITLKIFNPKLNGEPLKNGTIVYLFNMANNSAPIAQKDTIKVIEQKPKNLLNLPLLKNKKN